MHYGILVQGFKVQNLVEEYKSISLGKRDKHWKFLKSLLLYLSSV